MGHLPSVGKVQGGGDFLENANCFFPEQRPFLLDLGGQVAAVNQLHGDVEPPCVNVYSPKNNPKAALPQFDFNPVFAKLIVSRLCNCYVAVNP